MSLESVIAEYEGRVMEVAVCFFVRDGQIMLASKKRKIGSGLLNGPGGKLKPGETPAEGMVREAFEEHDAMPTGWYQVADVGCYFLESPEWNMHCPVYFVTDWEGEPKETDEMGEPEWFPFDAVPWERMWPNDRLWLAEVLAGRTVWARFLLDGSRMPVESIVRDANFA